MAHFAEIDEDGIVLRVVVISNDDILDESGNESEQIGIQLCNTLVGDSATWVQTSYNSNFRRNFAYVGFKYSKEKDVFYNPVPPYPSWGLDGDLLWSAPLPRPTDGKKYNWNEETLSWIEVVISEETDA